MALDLVYQDRGTIIHRLDPRVKLLWWLSINVTLATWKPGLAELAPRSALYLICTDSEHRFLATPTWSGCTLYRICGASWYSSHSSHTFLLGNCRVLHRHDVAFVDHCIKHPYPH